MSKPPPFAANLARAIKRRQTSRYAVSQTTGISQIALSHYVRGLRIPDVATLRKLADHLEVTMDELYPTENDR
jgi:transcriptional regulator with XRE-family HTH domain